MDNDCHEDQREDGWRPQATRPNRGMEYDDDDDERRCRIT
jgi:hypothetical protein